jgi:hypothetical protein
LYCQSVFLTSKWTTITYISFFSIRNKKSFLNMTSFHWIIINLNFFGTDGWVNVNIGGEYLYIARILHKLIVWMSAHWLELFQNGTLKQNLNSAKNIPAFLRDLHLLQLPNYTDSKCISSHICNWTHSIKLKKY